jgi:hypothetical protein
MLESLVSSAKDAESLDIVEKFLWEQKSFNVELLATLRPLKERFSQLIITQNMRYQALARLLDLERRPQIVLA